MDHVLVHVLQNTFTLLQLLGGRRLVGLGHDVVVSHGLGQRNKDSLVCQT